MLQLYPPIYYGLSNIGANICVYMEHLRGGMQRSDGWSGNVECLILECRGSARVINYPS